MKIINFMKKIVSWLSSFFKKNKSYYKEKRFYYDNMFGEDIWRNLGIWKMDTNKGAEMEKVNSVAEGEVVSKQLSAQQIALLLEIISKASFAGSSIEVVLQLKQTLILMLQEKQKQVSK